MAWEVPVSLLLLGTLLGLSVLVVLLPLALLIIYVVDRTPVSLVVITVVVVTVCRT